MKRSIVHFLVFITALLMSGFTEQGKWLIDEGSTLLIHGTTNVNSFKCMLGSYPKVDTLEYRAESGTIEIRVNRNKMSIPIRNFDCGSRQITRDFWQTLKSEKHPYLVIYFRYFKNGTIADNAPIDGVVDITLAGATKRYVVRYHARVPEKNKIHLTGTQTVNFADFKLTPPEKMMGLIQVQECLDVEFNLTLTSL